MRSSTRRITRATARRVSRVAMIPKCSTARAALRICSSGSTTSSRSTPTARSPWTSTISKASARSLTLYFTDGLTVGMARSCIPPTSDGDPMRPTHQYRVPAVTALFLIASCASPDAAPTDPAVITPHVWAAKGGPPPPDSVRLAMTVSDDPAFQVGSDLKGDYFDGADGMRAIIDQ